jgi:hypothetical protein
MEGSGEAAGPGFEPGLSDSESVPIRSWPFLIVTKTT